MKWRKLTLINGIHSIQPHVFVVKQMFTEQLLSMLNTLLGGEAGRGRSIDKVWLCFSLQADFNLEG